MLLNTPQNVWATCCARITNVTWVQLCSRLQQAAKRRVDQHPAVTAVPEKPRAPIQLSCGNALNGLRSFLFLQDILCTYNMANCSKHFSCLRARQSVVNHPQTVSHAANCMCFRHLDDWSHTSCVIHTVHGGAEPRACLTGLRV